MSSLLFYFYPNLFTEKMKNISLFLQDKTKQVQRIRSLFHRQLSVPLTNSRSTLLAYKLWEVERGSTIDVNSDDCDGLPSHTKSAYQKAMQMFNDRVQYEDQLSQCDSSETERLKHFMVR